MSSSHPSIFVANLNKLGLSDTLETFGLAWNIFLSVFHPVHYTDFQLQKTEIPEQCSILFFVSSATYTKQTIYYSCLVLYASQ